MRGLRRRLERLELARPQIKRAGSLWDNLTADQCEHYALTGELPAGVTEAALAAETTWSPFDSFTAEQCEHYALTGELPAGVDPECLYLGGRAERGG